MKNSIKLAMAALALTMFAQPSNALLANQNVGRQFLDDCGTSGDSVKCTFEIAATIVSSLPTFIVGADGQPAISDLKVKAAVEVLNSKHATQEQKDAARAVLKEISE